MKKISLSPFFTAIISEIEQKSSTFVDYFGYCATTITAAGNLKD